MVKLENILLALPFISIVSGFKGRTLHLNNEFSSNSKAGRDLIASSTLVEGSRSLEEYEYNINFVGDYSIKFLDCHSVNQWNGDSDGDEEASRIVASNLVRYRLCPTNSCSSKTSSGCQSKFGDYLVDINTFAYSYLSAQASQNQNIQSSCSGECSYGDDDCVQSCFEKNGGYSFYDNDGTSFDPADYAQCAAYKDYYLGPTCSNDGKSIFLGLFGDEGCTEYSDCSSSCFKSKYGYNLPFSDTSIISKTCVSCKNNYNYASNTCKELYSNSGKCETRMSIAYPNESACIYIEGIKYLQKDGTISSNSIKRSKGASLAIGFVSFSSILLGTYVHYLLLSKSRNDP